MECYTTGHLCSNKDRNVLPRTTNNKRQNIRLQIEATAYFFSITYERV